jgi:hypothetical protein
MELPELRQNNLSKNLIFHLHGGMDDLLTTMVRMVLHMWIQRIITFGQPLKKNNLMLQH